MSDDVQEPESSASPELGPVVARLQEIHRKCLSLGARNDEAREMAGRLEGVIAALSGGSGSNVPPTVFGDLADRLFPVARLFESLGFLSVARELSHVERILTDLDPGPPANAPPTAFGETSARSVEPPLPDDVIDSAEDDEGGEPPSAHRSVPVPVVFGLLVVLIAVVVSVVVVRKQQTRYDNRSVSPTGPLTMPPTLTAIPTPFDPTTVGATPLAAETPTPGPRARLAALVGEARLAQREGDIERAISLLSQAALIDSKASTVLETARSQVADLLGRADAAAAAARWDEAAATVDRARELAIRFELPTEPMEAAVRRHARLERYERVAPTDIARLKELASNRAVVVTNDDSRHEGRILDVVNGVLELHQGMEVGRGGTLFHVDEIPLVEIAEIRVYPD